MLWFFFMVKLCLLNLREYPCRVIWLFVGMWWRQFVTIFMLRVTWGAVCGRSWFLTMFLSCALLQLVWRSRNVLQKPMNECRSFPLLSFACFLLPPSPGPFLKQIQWYSYSLSLKFVFPINLFFPWIIPTFFFKILICASLGFVLLQPVLFATQHTSLPLNVKHVQISSVFYNVLITILTGYWVITVRQRVNEPFK